MGFERELGDGLRLRAVRDEHDIERFAQFHTAFVSRSEGISCSNLLHHHPNIRHEDFLLVEQRDTGEVVSTICLIPWHLDFDGIPLDAAMLEMVLTHPAYRRRGLVRVQIERFHEMVRERGFALSVIEGIPYYYRQFGYAYACDHWGRDSLLTARIPDQPLGHEEQVAFRTATPADIPALAQLYDQAMGRLALWTRRSPALWRFLLEAERYPVRVVVDARDGAMRGYVAALDGGRRVHVTESVLPDYQTGMAVLRELRQEAKGGEIQLGWPRSATLAQLGRALGSFPTPAYQWLVRVTDVAELLNRLGPAFNRRLARSPCAGLTAELVVNLFHRAFALRFEAGSLLEARSLGFRDTSMGADGGDLCIPPDAFVRLVLGYRDLDELHDAWPDIRVRPSSRAILEVLFPRVESAIWMPYLYYGPT